MPSNVKSNKKIKFEKMEPIREYKIKVSEVLNLTIGTLTKIGVDNPQLDAEILLSSVMCWDKSKLYAYPEKELTTSQLEMMRFLVRRRKAREPIAYIFGTKEFYGRPFKVTPSVLIPRPETEMIIDIALGFLNNNSFPDLTIFDLCTGSGCIAVTLGCELSKTLNHFSIVASDMSKSALRIAQQNATAYEIDITFRDGDLWKSLSSCIKSRKFDLILCNPPYIKSSVLKKLPPEISVHEPKIALDGGEDGLYVYSRILADVNKWLSEKGLMLLEIDPSVLEDIKELADNNNLHINKIHEDYGGYSRVAEIQTKH